MDIASMLEVQVDVVKEAESKENVTPGDLVPSTTNVAPPVSSEMSTVFKLMFSNDIASVRFHRLHCTACDAHIGSAPSQASNMSEHPVLHTLICADCRNFYGDGTFEQGDDATDMFCRWCANGGNLYCCSYCSNTFCYNCIKRNFDAIVVKKIEADEKWKCFVCNPTELTAARAICWALLQHVQTVTRILQNNRKMSPTEKEEKMNLDETQCCTRKRKRKWRKNCSPTVPFNNSRVRKPVVARRRSLNSGMYLRLVPMVPAKDAVRQHNLSLPSLSCEQSNPESPSHAMNNVTVSTVPKSSDQSSSLQCDRPLPYNSSNMITAVPTASLLQNPPPHQVLVSHPPSYSSSTHSSSTHSSSTHSSSTHSSSTPMVAIPNQNASQILNHHQQVPLSKRKRSATMIVTPNIIDLDSDSDEPTVVEPPPVSNVIIDDDVDIVSVVPAPAVPVALVSNGHIHNGVHSSMPEPGAQTKSNAFIVSTNNTACGVNSSETNTAPKDSSPLREISTSLEEQSKPFSDILLPHTNDVEAILKKLKQKFAKLFEGTKDKNSEARANKIARNLVMHFYRDVCITVKELATVNDRVIREYNSWKRVHEIEDHAQPTVSRRKRKRHNSTDISLDMACVNESDAESDSSEDPEDSIIIPSELIGATNALEDVLLFKKLNTVERGIGDRSILSNDKAIQVHTNEEPILPMDFEQGIAYTVLRRNNRKRSTKSSTLQRTVAPTDHIGKFEEQFIYYLQHIEDHGIQADESEDSFETKETALNELLEVDSPKLVNNIITEILGNMDMSTRETSSETCETREPQREEANDVPDEIIVVEEVESVTASEGVSTAVDEFTTVVKKLTDNVESSGYGGLSTLTSDKNCSANNKMSSIPTPTNTEDPNDSEPYLMDVDVEEDCTIIDD